MKTVPAAFTPLGTSVEDKLTRGPALSRAFLLYGTENCVLTPSRRQVYQRTGVGLKLWLVLDTDAWEGRAQA